MYTVPCALYTQTYCSYKHLLMDTEVLSEVLFPTQFDATTLMLCLKLYGSVKIELVLKVGDMSTTDKSLETMTV